MDRISAYFRNMEDVLRAMPHGDIASSIATLIGAYRADRQVFVVGNGGSASTASHFANDLAKGARRPDCRPWRVIALTDNVPLITAWANDVSYDEVFACQLDALVYPGDVLVAISGSGDSPNVLRAVEVARERGVASIGLTGGTGGKLKHMVDVCVIVPSPAMNVIEDAHLMLTHLFATYVRDEGAALMPQAVAADRLPQWFVRRETNGNGRIPAYAEVSANGDKEIGS